MESGHDRIVQFVDLNQIVRHLISGHVDQIHGVSYSVDDLVQAFLDPTFRQVISAPRERVANLDHLVLQYPSVLE